MNVQKLLEFNMSKPLCPSSIFSALVAILIPLSLMGCMGSKTVKGGLRGLVPEIEKASEKRETGEKAENEEQFTCAGPVSISGVILTEDKSYRLDLASLSPTVEMRHKVDIDAFEDRCVNAVTIRLEEDPGCVLELELGADGRSDSLAIRKATFVADSYCASWPDHLEGTYRFLGKGRMEISPILVQDSTAIQSCTEHNIAGHLVLRGLKRERRRLDVSIIARGVFPSTGDTSNALVCPGPQKELEVPLEIYVGMGAAVAPNGGNSAEWQFTTPVLPKLDFGLRMGKKWFVGLERNSYFEGGMAKHYIDYSGGNTAFTVGFRFKPNGRFQMPIALKLGSSKAEFDDFRDVYDDYDDYDDYYDYNYYGYDLSNSENSWFVGLQLQPTVRFYDGPKVDVSGFLKWDVNFGTLPSNTIGFAGGVSAQFLIPVGGASD
jgi:hypothetical protein